jgi:hypothetical protein
MSRALVLTISGLQVLDRMIAFSTTYAVRGPALLKVAFAFVTDPSYADRMELVHGCCEDCFLGLAVSGFPQ